MSNSVLLGLDSNDRVVENTKVRNIKASISHENSNKNSMDCVEILIIEMYVNHDEEERGGSRI